MYAEQRNWEASFTEKWFWTKAQFDMLQRLHAISLSWNREQWMTLSWLCFAFCQCCLWGLWPCSVVCSLLPSHPVHHITWTTLTTALDNTLLVKTDHGLWTAGIAGTMQLLQFSRCPRLFLHFNCIEPKIYLSCSHTVCACKSPSRGISF